MNQYKHWCSSSLVITIRYDRTILH